MFISRLALATALLCAAPARAGSPEAHVETCYEGEQSSLHCYSGKDDTPQKVNVDDVQAVAKALRDYGREVEGGRFFTMTAENAPDCAEWRLYDHGSVLTLAKHLGTEKNSSVLFEDIARTIDGGPSASNQDKEGAIVGCWSNGGSLGVLVNETNPAYRSHEYEESGYTAEGIVVKIVSNGREVDL